MSVTIVDMVRSGLFDAELGSLLWLLASNRVPIHVVPGDADLAAAIRDVAADPSIVTHGPGVSIEEVLRQPVPLRPPSGAVVVLDGTGRVAAAHLLRPPLRDGAGHVRPQGPAVLAARLVSEDRLEHFAWGVMPELAAGLDRKAGDLEAELDERAAWLRGAAESAPGDPDALVLALRSWSRPVRAT
jgi:hypothetical protein